jgi:hypothetical protein
MLFRPLTRVSMSDCTTFSIFKFSNCIFKFCILSTSMLFTKSTLYVSSSVNILESLNIPVGRINKDSVKNHYGSRLLDLCKGNNSILIKREFKQ